MNFNDFLEKYDDILMPEDLQKILHIGRNAVYNYLADGTIKSLRIGKKYRIPKLYLLEYLYPDMDIDVKEVK